MTLENSSQKLPKAHSKEMTTKLSRLATRRVQQGRLLKPGTYMKFMEHLKTKPVQGPREKHHIVPKHMGGTDQPSNLIAISVRDHCLAHLLLYLEKGKRGDLIAYVLRQSSQHIDMKSQGQRIAFINKTLGNNRWNSNMQRELGLRGGSKGGLKNSEAQKIARSAVGREWGRSVGLSRQSEHLKGQLSMTLVFQHKDRLDEMFYVPSQGSVVEIARFLNQECESRQFPELTLDLAKVQAGGPFYGLIKMTKKSAYGWVIADRILGTDFED